MIYGGHVRRTQIITDTQAGVREVVTTEVSPVPAHESATDRRTERLKLYVLIAGCATLAIIGGHAAARP